MSGIKEVARHAGVSVGTVSNVLNRPDVVAASTVSRVKQAISELGYVPNGAARQLRVGRSRAVGMVVLDVANPFFAGVVQSVEDAAQRSGLVVFVADSGQDEVRERHALDVFAEQQVRGVLLSPATADRSNLVALAARDIPVVLVDGRDDSGVLRSVSVDNVSGGRAAALHLLQQGWRRLMFVGRHDGVQQVQDRLAGARLAVAGSASALLEEVDTPELTVLAGRAIGYTIARRPVSSRPEAVFAANDLLAIGIMQAFVTSGVRIPEDVALIGYDDIDFAQSAIVPLSSVGQPTVEMGAVALALLLEEEAHTPHRSVELKPHLVVRSSSRRP